MSKYFPKPHIFGKYTNTKTRRKYNIVQLDEENYSDSIVAYDSESECAIGSNLTLTELIKPVVPNVVKAWQAKAVLVSMNLFDLVQTTIESIEDPNERNTIKSAWDHNADFERYTSTTIGLGVAIGLSDALMDELFIKANDLKL
jgi:hypothetical protein